MAQDIQKLRRERLRSLIEAKPYGGNLSELGRALGYKDGVFVRQMRDGERPITEKTVAKVEKLPGRAGWFGSTHEALQLSPAAIALGAYFDRATAEERALLARVIPIDIDLSQPEPPEVPGLDTNYQDDLDDKKRRSK